MMLKQLNRAAKTAWCPDPKFGTFMVSGTVAGSYNENFEAQSQLEIYDANLTTASLEMRCMGSISSKDTFHSLAWGAKGIADQTFPCGIIAGGMSTGALMLWDAASILRYKEQREKRQTPLICRMDAHKDQILGLDFHPQQVNLLASCSSDGSVLVWDLKRTTSPTYQTPSKKVNTSRMQAITCTQWNKKVPQILASSNAAGETTIWDLRKSLPIITVKHSFQYNQNVKGNGLAWNPDSAVQLGICYNAPVAEIWDLRQMRSGLPLSKLMNGHSGSILSLAWNSYDSNILVSTGDDGRVCCWDPKTGNVQHEYPQQGNINYDLQWCPNVPSILSTCSFEGQVTLQSIQNAGKHVPRWLKKKSGVSFGFGGRLVSFGAKADQKNHTEMGTTKISIKKLVTEPKLIEMSKKFQQIISDESYLDLCDNKIKSSNLNDNEKQIWKYLSILFKPDNERKVCLLKELGYDAPPSLPSTEEISNTEQQSTEEVKGTVSSLSSSLSNNNNITADVSEPDPVDDVDFFNQDFDMDDDLMNSSGIMASEDSLKDVIETKESVSSSSLSDNMKKHINESIINTNDTDSPEDISIEKAMIVGDFKKAIDLCIEFKRLADALVISSFANDNGLLWKYTQDIYFKSHEQTFMKNTMSLLVDYNLEKIIDNSSIKQWKRTLAILLTYAKGGEQPKLINRLAAQLKQFSSSIIPTIICYICAGNVDAVASIWSNESTKHTENSTLSLHYAIEKIVTFTAANAVMNGGNTGTHESVSEQYASYATLLASQGNLSGAFDFLQLATSNGQGIGEASQMLLHRIAQAQIKPVIQQQTPVVVANIQQQPIVNNNISSTTARYGQQSRPISNKNNNTALYNPNQGISSPTRNFPMNNTNNTTPAGKQGQQMPPSSTTNNNIASRVNRPGSFTQQQSINQMKPQDNMPIRGGGNGGIQQSRPGMTTPMNTPAMPTRGGSIVQQTMPNRAQPMTTPMNTPAMPTRGGSIVQPTHVNNNMQNNISQPMPSMPIMPSNNNQVMPNRAQPMPTIPNQVMPNRSMPNQVMPNRAQPMPNQVMPNRGQPMPSNNNQVMPNRGQPMPSNNNQVMPNRGQPMPSNNNQVMPNRGQPMPNQAMNNTNNMPMNNSFIQKPMTPIQSIPKSVIPSSSVPVSSSVSASPAAMQAVSCIMQLTERLGSMQLSSTDSRNLKKALNVVQNIGSSFDTLAPPAQAIVNQMCESFQRSDFKEADGLHKKLVQNYFTGNASWLTPLRTIIMISKKNIR